MPGFGDCCLPVRQLSWVQSLLRKKVTIEDLPEDLLLDVLSLVPRKDLVLNCRRVCSRWRDLVDLPVLWKRKCGCMGFRPERSDGGPPDWRAHCFHYGNRSLTDWRALCFQHSQRNLVKNPCGEEFLDFWQVNNQPHWEVSEIVPERHVQFYERSLRIPHPPPEIQRAFVFVCPEDGYIESGTKRQRITLREEGYSNWLMDESRPKIVVKDWHYFNGCSQSKLHVKLLSAGLEVLQECVLTSDNYEWWNEFSHAFEDYPPGVRHIDLEHEAVAQPGVKITGTSLTIDPEGIRQGAAAKKDPSLPIFSLCGFS